MPLPRTSLSTFLATAKSALTQKTPLTFVIGNESADLDSLCSAVVLAYLRTSTSPSQSLYIPLSNLPRADLSLRPELLPVLSKAHLSPNDLITLSDLPALSSLLPDRTRWILVDHNALQGELGKLYADRVVGCIDHHDEENKVPQDTGDEPRVVRKSGSCASLVIEYCRSAWSALPKTSETAAWDEELAYLALAPILIDTTELKSTSKVTDADISSVKFLESMTQTGYDREAYFTALSHAKEDVGKLSLNDILRKDYKQWTEGSANLGISSVVKDMQFLVSHAGGKEKFLSIVESFAKERDLSICSIMTTSHQNGEFKRELLVWGTNESGVEDAKRFEKEAGEKLGLKTWNQGILDQVGETQTQWRKCWWQQRVENSRKQVGPLLRSSMAGAKL